MQSVFNVNQRLADGRGVHAFSWQVHEMGWRQDDE